MSSRLFSTFASARLAYDVSQLHPEQPDTGYLGVYIGVDPKKAIDAVNAAMASFAP